MYLYLQKRQIFNNKIIYDEILNAVESFYQIILVFVNFILGKTFCN